MHIITICYVKDLREIIDHPINLSGIVSEEIDDNMWCITLEEDCLSRFTQDSMVQFFDTLIAKKSHQIHLLNPQMQATFYLWFDRQALQLRLNILSGVVINLPFQCRVQKTASLAYIIDDFLQTVRSVVQQAEQIEFIEPAAPDFDDDETDDDEDFTLDVYTIVLNQNGATDFRP